MCDVILSHKENYTKFTLKYEIAVMECKRFIKSKCILKNIVLKTAIKKSPFFLHTSCAF